MRSPIAKAHELVDRAEENLEDFVENAARGLHQVTRTLIERSSDTSSSSSSTCSAGDTSSKCVTPAAVESSQNLAIILGVVIPLSCAIIVLIFLHRRHMRKQRQEDINDPHRSLDFGMDGIEPVTSNRGRGRRRGGPEMTTTQPNPSTRTGTRGLSMDMNLGNPYLLPAALTGSRETLHSMTRNAVDEHDPYRPVTLMRPSTDNDSIRFGRLNSDDNRSLYSMSTGNHSTSQDKAGLIVNARPMSQSFGKRADSISPQDTSPPDDFPLRQLHSSTNRTSPPTRKSSTEKPLPEIQEREILVTPPSDIQPIALQAPPPARTASEGQRTISASSAPRPPRKDSMSSAHDSRPESSNYGDEETPPAHRITINEPQPYDIDPSMIHDRYSEFELPATQFEPSPESSPGLQAPRVPPQNNRLSVMGLRPLPTNLPEDNPEVRANRIRSFYKEYFDDSKPGPGPAQATYENDGYMDFLDGVIYDPDSGGFYAPQKPFAGGPGRRAMTPPPRARPRVSGNSAGGPHGRQFSTQSMGRPRGRSLPRKKLPPPKPLNSLMTPHLMRDDSAIFNAIDFAPPSTFRNMQNGGRPDSPMGISRPYSPSVRAFTPLASSFDNLSVLPSPHDLRKSGTFTALDFAPPSKIRDPGSLSPSDAGSIRSNRSGVSAMQSNAIRAGAYRVSRIPAALVTTNEDLGKQLRPQMNMTTPA